MRTRVVFGLLLTLAAPCVSASAEVPKGEYAARRARLLEQIEAPVALIGYGGAEFGISGKERAQPETTFRQEENFYYLSGHREPGAALLLVPQTEAARAANLPAEILFLPKRDSLHERWEGARLAPDDPGIKQQTGFAAVRPTSQFEAELKRVAPVFPRLYTLFSPEGSEEEDTYAERHVERLKQLLPQTKLEDVRAAIGALRQVKSPAELALLRVSVEHTLEAHRQAMRALRPGLYEYEIAALMEYTFERAGCERPAYPPIVGSGPNSTVLHYSESRRQMQAGEVVVIDVGPECGGYASDVTRTLPVSGKFNERQREIYQIVLAAQQAAMAAVRPGMTLAKEGENSLYKIAYDYINTHGKDKHGQPLGQYFIHGLGHHVGLAVHDAGDPYRPLEPGMVVTIEPGIYIPEENLGVRIEDMVLVTKDGGELLTDSLPRGAAEIEQAILAARQEHRTGNQE